MTASIPIFSPMVRVLDANGDPVANGTVEFYDAGTSTPKTVYADAALGTSLGTTVSTDAGGYPITSGNARTLVYTGTDPFKMIVKDEDDATLVTHDNVPGAVVVPEADTSALSQTPVVSKTTTYSVVAGDQGKLLNCNCTSGSFAVTLLSAVTADDGFEVTVRHVGTANEVTIRAAGSETISRSGGTSNSVALKGYGQAVTLVADGTNWHVKASADPLVLDGLPNFSVADRLTAPPTSPTPGARYIINGTPTGAWSTLGFAEKQVVEADGNGSWFKYTPAEGWSAWIADEALHTVYTSGAWVDWTNVTAPTETTLECASFSHTVSNGTAGGSGTGSAWTARPLNTTDSNTITGCSLGSNQITLPVGTYLITGWQSLVQTTYAQSRIKVISGTATPDPILNSFSLNYGNDSAGHSPGHIPGAWPISGILTVTATAVIEFQYWFSGGAGGTNTLGTASGEPTGSSEVYARIAILSLTAIQGPAGEQGAQGSDGLDAAYDFQWNTATSGDPGSGKLLLNHATFASVTQINISEATNSGASIADVLATWDDSTSSVRGQIKFSKEGTPGTYRALNITGAGTDAGTYWTFPVTPVDDNGTLSSNDDLAVIHTRTGDKGDTGTTGAQGDPGTPGSTGATGPNTGLDYAWATATSGDPGSGKVLANNATLASATAINISKTGRNSESLGAVIATWDDSTNTAHYGHLRIFTVADRTEYIEAEVTGLTDNSTYYAVAVAVTAANGTPSANDVMAVMFDRTGNKGSDGAGTGDVVGPASSTNNGFVKFDGTTGKLVKDSAATVAIGSEVSGLGTGVATFLATPSSANLAAALTDETGSGAAVFATSPTLVTPALGTPASGTLTNCTGLPQAGTTGLTTADSPQFTAVNIGHASDTTVARDSAGIISVEGVPLYSQVPQNSQSAAYTLVLADAQKHILHPTADNNARTFTIPANSSVAFPIGTCITFINEINTVTIAITTDTMKLAGAGTTGSRTLAANGMATAIKTASTTWWISGTGLT